MFIHRHRQIEATLPYPQTGDERPLAQAALHILKTHDANPHFFRYPSLPIYGAALGFELGVLQASAKKELRNVTDVKSVRSPAYSHPTVVKAGRQLFLLLGVLGLYLCGVAAARAFKQPILRVVAPILLALVPLYGFQAWAYLNVDIWAAVMTLATLAWLSSSFCSRGFVAKALVPGVLTAAAAASKYNTGIVIVPCVLSVFFFETRGRRVIRMFQLAAVVAVGFVVFCPYSVLAPQEFAEGVLYEIRHYATGHAGAAYTPNVGQHVVRNLTVIYEQLGAALCALAVWGMFIAFRLEWRRSLVLASAFAAPLCFMSLQKVHFPRNLLPALASLTIFASFGAVAAVSVLGCRLKRFVPRRSALAMAAIGVALVGVGSTDRPLLRSSWKVQVDSRREAAEWLNKSVPHGATVLVDRALDFDPRGWRKGIEVRTLDPSAMLAERSTASSQVRFMVLRSGKETPKELRRAMHDVEAKLTSGTGKAKWLVVNPRLAVFSLDAAD